MSINTMNKFKIKNTLQSQEHSKKKGRAYTPAECVKNRMSICEEIERWEREKMQYLCL